MQTYNDKDRPNMTLADIYRDKKSILDYGYGEWFNEIYREIEKDSKYSLSSDEVIELVYDLIISNVLGEIIRYDEVQEIIKQSKHNPL